MKLFSKLRQIYIGFSGLSKKRKVMVYCAAFLLAAAFIDRTMIYPVSSRIRELNKEIKEKESAIKKDARILFMKDRILKETSEYSSMFSATKSEDEENTLLLKEIENLANKSSVYLIDIKPSGTRQGPSGKFLINLNCEAQMEQLIDFMYNIENSVQLLIIEKFQISRKSSESSVARCAMTISKMAISSESK
jgi:hypothetical protein